MNTAQSILPGATIGVLGSGQLGRMLAMAARRMGGAVARRGHVGGDGALIGAIGGVTGNIGGGTGVSRRIDRLGAAAFGGTFFRQRDEVGRGLGLDDIAAEVGHCHVAPAGRLVRDRDAKK